MAEEHKPGYKSSAFIVTTVCVAASAGLSAAALFFPHPFVQIAAVVVGSICATLTGTTYVAQNGKLKAAREAHPALPTVREPPAP